MAADKQAIRDVWTRTVERAKQATVSPTLYRAIERAVPVAWEDSMFAVGFAPADGQMAGVLNTTEYTLLIERALREMAQDSGLRLRIIEGNTYADWQHTKERDAAALVSRQQSVKKRSTESAAFNSWDDIYDQVSRLYPNAEYRTLATGRARYIENALTIVATAMDKLYPADDKTDEPTERGLSRVIERIGSMTGTDPVVIAMLLLQRRK